MEELTGWTGYEEPVVKAAALLARRLHEGQKDKGGHDYFASHLTAVAKAGSGWKEHVVGFLHDAAEDTNHTVEEVISALKAELAEQPQVPGAVVPSDADWAEIADALGTMNHFTAPGREEYIARFRGHPLAIKVKLHDMANNMDMSRIPSPTQRDLDRLERYKKEFVLLKGML